MSSLKGKPDFARRTERVGMKVPDISGRGVAGADNKEPEMVAGLPKASSKISGFRRRDSVRKGLIRSAIEAGVDPSTILDGTIEIPEDLRRNRPDDEIEIDVDVEEMSTEDAETLEAEAMAAETVGIIEETHRRLNTLIEASIAKARLRELRLDDDLDQPVDRQALEAIIADRSKWREKTIKILNGSNGAFLREWWNSTDIVERLWGQLNVGAFVVPRWQFVNDLKAVLGENIENDRPTGNVRPAGTSHEYFRALMSNQGMFRQKVYAKLVSQGFPEGEGNRIYGHQDLADIIATTPKERPDR